MLRLRIAIGLAGGIAFLAGAYLSAGPPELTLLNSSLRIAYPWPRAAAALLAGAGAGASAWALHRRWLRLPAAAVALLALAGAVHLSVYRVEAGDEAIVADGLLSRQRIAWEDVSRVEAGPGVLVIFRGPEVRVRVDTVDYSAAQRASLERTITRRVRETAGERALPAGPLK